MELHLPWVMNIRWIFLMWFFLCVCGSVTCCLGYLLKINTSTTPIILSSLILDTIFCWKNKKMVAEFIHCLWCETKVLHRCGTWFQLCSVSGPRDSTAVRNAVCHEVRGTAPFPSTDPWILHCTNPNLFSQCSLLHLSQLTGSAQQKLSQGHARKSLPENARTDQFCPSV